MPPPNIAEVQGVAFTLIDKSGSELRDSMGNVKQVIICKDATKTIPELDDISVTVVNFANTQYPSDKPEIPASVEVIINS